MDTYSIGSVYSRAFGLVKGTLGSAGLMVLLVLLVSGAIRYALIASMLGGLQGATPADPGAALALLGSPFYYLVMLASFALSSLAMAGATHAMLAYSSRATPSLGETVNGGVVKMIPLFLLTLLWGLGVAVGWILLVVPGIILMTMWSVSVPALIGENAGIIGSFGRSRALTRGLRWNIFATLLVFVILFYIVVFGLLFLLLGIGIAGASSMMNLSPLTTLVTIPMRWLGYMALIALLSSIYLETIKVKEGGSSAQLNEVFA